MAQAELIAALQRETEQQARAAWRAAEAEVAERRTELAAEVDRLKKEAVGRATRAAEELRRARLASAEQQAAAQTLEAEVQLAERLKCLAEQRLNELYAEQRARFWPRLWRELPAGEWQRAEVDPADLEQARRTVPGVHFEAVAGFGGGMVVEGLDGRLRVDNSLRCRLERSWWHLLPGVMASVRREVESDGSLESDSTE